MIPALWFDASSLLTIGITAALTFVACAIGVPLALAVMRAMSLYTIVRERQVVVYELFGKVRLVLDQPGIHSPWSAMGPFAMLVPMAGKRHVVDVRLDQIYLRSQPVNSEEGAPMGVGVWCEMMVSDPIAYLYRNTDPAGSLAANISNAAVRCLSNMGLSDMLENRHSMSRAVRQEVSLKSREWGYDPGSIYIRKVHLRDPGMIAQIEQKVVNRLRQVTATIQQDGANRVSLIRSNAERRAAVEFAKAAATRPRIVGDALARIAQEPQVCRALFTLLETQNLLESKGLQVRLLPAGTTMIASFGA